MSNASDNLERSAATAHEVADATIDLLRQVGFQIFIDDGQQTTAIDGLTDQTPWSTVIQRYESKTQRSTDTLYFTLSGRPVAGAMDREAVATESAAIGPIAGQTVQGKERLRGGFHEAEAASDLIVKPRSRRFALEEVPVLRFLMRSPDLDLLPRPHGSRSVGADLMARAFMDFQSREQVLQFEAAWNKQWGEHRDSYDLALAACAALVAQPRPPGNASQWAYLARMYPHSGSSHPFMRVVEPASRTEASAQTGPDNKGVSSGFDHYVAFTYPDSVPIQAISQLPEPDRATVIDPLGNRIVPLTAFLRGENAYGVDLTGHASGGLEIVDAPFACTGQGIDDTAKAKARSLFAAQLHQTRGTAGFQDEVRASRAIQAVLPEPEAFPIADEVEDLRSLDDRLAKVQRSIQSQRLAVAELHELTDRELLKTYLEKPEWRDPLMRYRSIRKRLYGCVLALPPTEAVQAIGRTFAEPHLKEFALSSSTALRLVVSTPYGARGLAYELVPLLTADELEAVCDPSGVADDDLFGALFRAARLTGHPFCTREAPQSRAQALGLVESRLPDVDEVVKAWSTTSLKVTHSVWAQGSHGRVLVSESVAQFYPLEGSGPAIALTPRHVALLRDRLAAERGSVDDPKLSRTYARALGILGLPPEEANSVEVFLHAVLSNWRTEGGHADAPALEEHTILIFTAIEEAESSPVHLESGRRKLTLIPVNEVRFQAAAADIRRFPELKDPLTLSAPQRNDLRRRLLIELSGGTRPDLLRPALDNLNVVLAQADAAMTSDPDEEKERPGAPLDWMTSAIAEIMSPF